MNSSGGQNRIFLALCANAAALLLILFMLVLRNDSANVNSSAFAQSLPPTQSPIAGGGGLFVMPAQLSPNTWGCYLMDTDNRTLCVYQYSPGEKMLRLTAARSFKNDCRLGNFNTAPPPGEVKDLADRELETPREAAPAQKSPEMQKSQ
jgi:hypothetical protein